MNLERARKAARLFGLDPDSVIPFAMRENHTFQASADDVTYALRLHRPGYSSHNGILAELQIMFMLAENGASVPVPRKSLNNQLVEEVEGQLSSVLSWVKGKTLEKTIQSSNANRATIYHALGEALARFHNHADAWTPPAGFTRRSWDREGLLGAEPVWGRFWENPYLSADQRKTLVELRKTLIAQLTSVESTLDYGLIHADAIGENVLIHDGKPTLIDFDDSGYGFRLFDLATPLNKERAAPDYADIEAAMFQGYRAHRPLETTRFRLIAQLRALTYLGWIVPRINEPGGQDRLTRFCKTAFSLV